MIIPPRAISGEHPGGHRLFAICATGENEKAMTKRMSKSDREGVRETFRGFLRDRGIKDTAQRRMVLEVALDLRDHFEADQLLKLLRERGSKVGKATLYRTLPLLVDCGILKQVRFDQKQAYYEHAFGEPPHDHMVCRRCGKIIEFAADETLELRNRIAKEHYFHVISHRFQICGLCWECSIACPVATIRLPKPASPGRKRRRK